MPYKLAQLRILLFHIYIRICTKYQRQNIRKDEERMIGQGDERNRRWCAGRQPNTSQRDETTRGLKTPTNDQTVALPHSVCPFWAGGPGAHFGSITFFVA
jgi:hypothetical protein